MEITRWILTPRPDLARAGRAPWLARRPAKIALLDLAALVLAGLAAAALWIWLQPVKLGVPGWAILRGVFPMTVGLALVPRSGAATVISTTATAACIVCGLLQLAHVQAAPMASLFLLGPLLDAAATRADSGWRLYARLTAAGLAANLIAFGVRLATAFWGVEPGVHNRFLTFWPGSLGSYAICGALAGLFSAAVCFRLRPRRQ